MVKDASNPSRSPLVSSGIPLSDSERSLYSRHILLPAFGLAGQQRLKGSRVLVIGAGGLGSPTLLYLAAAGVGTLGIVDDDKVEASNLQRQIIHTMGRVGRPKVDSAAEAIAELNPLVRVIKHVTRISADNAERLIRDYDLIIDGTDNFQSRYLINDACVAAFKPYVWGSIFRFEGHASVFWEQAPGGSGINYRDLFPQRPPAKYAPSCSEGGVFGVVCASIASIMATEAIKLLTGIGASLLGRVAVYDALAMEYRFFPITRNFQRNAADQFVDKPPASGKEPHEELALAQSNLPEIDAYELERRRSAKERFMLVDVRSQNEWDIVRIPGAVLFPAGMDGQRPFWQELEPDCHVVVYCKGGMRSSAVVKAMNEAGFSNVYNLGGGISSWVTTVCPNLPQY